MLVSVSAVRYPDSDNSRLLSQVETAEPRARYLCFQVVDFVLWKS